DWIAFTGEPEDPEFNKTPYIGLMVSGTGTRSFFTSGSFRSLRGFSPDIDRNNDNRHAIPTVRLTAKWGYSETPPKKVVGACLTQAAIWFKRGEGAWSDAIGAPETGQLHYTKVLDPAVQMMLVNAGLV